jgi:hypothetical protein
MAEGVLYVIPDGKAFAGDRCSKPMTSVKGDTTDAWYSSKGVPAWRQCPQAAMRPAAYPVSARTCTWP